MLLSLKGLLYMFVAENQRNPEKNRESLTWALGALPKVPDKSWCWLTAPYSHMEVGNRVDTCTAPWSSAVPTRNSTQLCSTLRWWVTVLTQAVS